MNYLWQGYYALIKHLSDEQVEINQRNNFKPLEQRSPEDQARFRELTEQMQTIAKAYDVEHFVGPCPGCGEDRPAHIGGVCINIGECKLAPYPGG